MALEKFHTGRSGMILGHSSSGFRLQTLQDPLLERVPDAEVGLLLWPAGPEGAALMGRPPVFGFNGFNPELSESELLRILQIVDFMCSEEGQDLAWFGIEGVHHTVENGRKVQLEDAQHEMWGGTPYWAHEMLMGQILRQQYEEDPITSRAWEFNAAHQVVNPLHFWTGDMVNTLNAEISEVFTRWWFDFVLGEKDPDTDWDDYVEALNDAGLAELTELAAEEMAR